MKKIWSEYARRVVICVAGLSLYGVFNLFCVKAGSVGTNAWNTLALGLSASGSMTFGTATLAISGAILLIDLLGRGKLGFGTLLNTLLIPVFSDIALVVLDFIPEAPNMAVGVLYTLIGQLGLSFAPIAYMAARLGCGPRDTLMIILGKKLPKVPIGAVKFAIEVAALACGVLLGAPFGIGTLLVMLLQASMFQLACRVCRYEPRKAEHEDFLDTLKRIKNSK